MIGRERADRTASWSHCTTYKEGIVGKGRGGEMTEGGGGGGTGGTGEGGIAFYLFPTSGESGSCNDTPPTGKVVDARAMTCQRRVFGT